MTDREERLLLSLLEAECEKAELIKEKWAATKIEDYDGDDDGLAYEVAFANGVSLGLSQARGIVAETINA